VVNRRTLLAAAAATGFAGCGAGKAPGSRTPAPPAATATPPAATATATATPAAGADAELLLPLIELKARAVAIYGGRPGLERLRAHERVHLARLLDAAPGRPFHYRVNTPPIELELEQLAAQLAVLPRLADPRLRTLIAGMYATDSEHLAVLRRGAGREAVPRAFVTGGT